MQQPKYITSAYVNDLCKVSQKCHHMHRCYVSVGVGVMRQNRRHNASSWLALIMNQDDRDDPDMVQESPNNLWANILHQLLLLDLMQTLEVLVTTIDALGYF